jgi:hypothetical protein
MTVGSDISAIAVKTWTGPFTKDLPGIGVLPPDMDVCFLVVRRRQQLKLEAHQKTVTKLASRGICHE